jgi:hypothetical protein
MCGTDSGYAMDAHKLDHRVGWRQRKRAVCVVKDERVSVERVSVYRYSRRHARC